MNTIVAAFFNVLVFCLISCFDEISAFLMSIICMAANVSFLCRAAFGPRTEMQKIQRIVDVGTCGVLLLVSLFMILATG